LPPAGGKKIKSFFTAACAWENIPLRREVIEFYRLRQNYARGRLGAFWQKNGDYSPETMKGLSQKPQPGKAIISKH